MRCFKHQSWMPEYNPTCSSIRQGLTGEKTRTTLGRQLGESHGEAGADLRDEAAARGRTWRSEGCDGGAEEWPHGACGHALDRRQQGRDREHLSPVDRSFL